MNIQLPSSNFQIQLPDPTSNFQIQLPDFKSRFWGTSKIQLPSSNFQLPKADEHHSDSLMMLHYKKRTVLWVKNYYLGIQLICPNSWRTAMNIDIYLCCLILRCTTRMWVLRWAAWANFLSQRSQAKSLLSSKGLWPRMCLSYCCLVLKWTSSKNNHKVWTTVLK